MNHHHPASQFFYLGNFVFETGSSLKLTTPQPFPPFLLFVMLGTHYVDQAGVELVAVLLPLPPGAETTGVSHT